MYVNDDIRLLFSCLNLTSVFYYWNKIWIRLYSKVTYNDIVLSF